VNVHRPLAAADCGIIDGSSNINCQSGIEVPVSL